MFSSVMSAAIWGVECIPVRVEADVSNGLPVFNMVGYLSSQVKEASERVRTAIKNIKISLPPKRITINLSPADIRKEGNRFDLPIAAALLGAFGFIDREKLSKVMIAGELSLDGRINPVHGILPMAETAVKNGCSLCIVPKENYKEACIAEGIRVLGIESLEEFIEAAGKENWGVQDRKKQEVLQYNTGFYGDFQEIKGQESLKRAAVIAAAGFHGLLITGAQGAGKTMIAKRIPGILPPLSKEECLEISRIYSIAGLLPEEEPLMTRHPFRAPHHTASAIALAGGGRNPRPGEITLAHRGVLFLDEFPEFSRQAVEVLRQPLEEHQILISRASGSFVFPAHFMLVAAMNHCPCGRYPDLNRCTCTDGEIQRYQNRISGPILDRIDLYVEAPPVEFVDISGEKTGKTSAEYAREVENAAQIQWERYKEETMTCNSELSHTLLRKYCPVSTDGGMLLKAAYEKLDLSARAYHKIIKTARTIADLEESEEIKEAHISEAICFRKVMKGQV